MRSLYIKHIRKIVRFIVLPLFFFLLPARGKVSASTLPGNRAYNIVYASCDWTIDPAVNYISGSVRFSILPELPADSIALDLADPMIVDSVTADNDVLLFDHSSDVLIIYFPSILPAGTLQTFTVFYQGSPVATNNRSFIADHHAGIPVVYTLSETYGARDWWPNKMDLNDKIDSIDLYITSPLNYRAASVGKLVSEDTTASSRTCHWKSNYPITSYLVGIGVTNYSVHHDTLVMQNGDTLPLLNYIYPENVQLAMQVLPGIKPILHLYDSLAIPYPFSKEKYGHAEFNVGGGMEHQTMSFIGNYSLGLIAHECAHQWFGDLITCSSFQDVWLNEGFATYFTGLMNEFLFPDEWQPWKAATLSSCLSVTGGSIYCSDTSDLGRIFDATLSYNRGAYLLHMLRWKLGDTDFFTSVKNYLSDPVLKYGYASTGDLKRHMEAVSSQDLDPFFNDWYYGSGYPEITAEWKRISEDVEITVFQSASDGSGSFFHVPVPLLLKSANRDTMVVVDPAFSGERFTFSPGFAVEEIVIDPELWLMCANKSVVERDDASERVSIFPNPGDGVFTIKSRRSELIVQDVQVIDNAGKCVFEKKFSENILRQTLDLSFLSQGIYTVNAHTREGQVRLKLILLR